MSETSSETAAPQYPWTPLSGRFRFMQLAFWLYATVVGIAIGFILYICPDLLAIRDGTLIDSYGASRRLEFVGTILERSVLVIGPLFIVCTIAYGRFMMRAMKNLMGIGETFEMSPGWLVGWYFIPIGNLFQPVEGVADIRRYSIHKLGQTWKASGAMMAWWVFWLLGGLSSGIVRFLENGIEDGNPTIDGIITVMIVSAASLLCYLLAAVFCVEVARGIRRLQDEIAEQGLQAPKGLSPAPAIG